MNEIVVKKIVAVSADVIIFDIDGTLKDLVLEHRVALKGGMNNIKKKKMRKKVVILLDKIAMWFVKTGMLPTNERMKKILTNIYAIVLNENFESFKTAYKLYYESENILFNNIERLLKELLEEKDVYFVTINKQNYNLDEHGIIQDRIIYTTSQKKIIAYQKLLEDKNLDKDSLLIVGDNLVDDIRAAKKLGIDSLLVDNYNSGVKRAMAKILNVGM